MLDMRAARPAYKAQEIKNIDFVRSLNSVANGLTKPKAQAASYQLLTKAYHKPNGE